MCFPSSIEPPTENTKKGVTYLKYLAFAQIIIILIKLLVIRDFSSFFEIMFVFLLYLAWSTLNFCTCVFYVLYCLYQILISIILFGTRLQNHLPMFGIAGTKDRVVLILTFLFTFYYLIACYITFISYKQFKIYQHEIQGLMVDNQRDTNIVNSNPNNIYFQGTGQRIG